MGEAVERGRPRGIGRALLDLLPRGSPGLCVIEDCHWADEATLDVLSYVTRRIGATGAVLLVTFRDDDLGLDHRLRAVVGSVPPADLIRVRLEPLSRSAVRELADNAVDVDPLFAATGGNPFLVTEALAAGGGPGVPATVRDALSARAARLSGAARAVLELVSVVPAEAELWLVEDQLGGVDDAVADVERSGLVVVDGRALRFRHELARHAYQESLPTLRRLELKQGTTRRWLGTRLRPVVPRPPNARTARRWRSTSEPCGTRKCSARRSERRRSRAFRPRPTPRARRPGARRPTLGNRASPRAR
jgi:hypothetical protein